MIAILCALLVIDTLVFTSVLMRTRDELATTKAAAARLQHYVIGIQDDLRCRDCGKFQRPGKCLHYAEPVATRSTSKVCPNWTERDCRATLGDGEDPNG